MIKKLKLKQFTTRVSKVLNVVIYNKIVVNEYGVYFTTQRLREKRRGTKGVFKSQQNVSCFLVTEAHEQALADELQWYHYIIDLELQESMDLFPGSSQAYSPVPSPASSQASSPSSSSPVIASSQASSPAVLVSSPATVCLHSNPSHQTIPFQYQTYFHSLEALKVFGYHAATSDEERTKDVRDFIY